MVSLSFKYFLKHMGSLEGFSNAVLRFKDLISSFLILRIKKEQLMKVQYTIQ